jgi:hypothetical protein
VFHLNSNKITSNHDKQAHHKPLSSITWSESHRMSCYCFYYHSKIIVLQSSRLCQRVDSSIFIVTRNTNPVGTDLCVHGHVWQGR